MKNKHYVCVWLAILFIITIVPGRPLLAEVSDAPSVLDFSDASPKQNFYTDLDGDWIFFEQALLTPEEVEIALKNGQGERVPIPDAFAAQTGDVNTFGTYSTMVKIPEDYVGKTLAIHIPYQYSAYILFADHGEIARNGVVGQDSDSHTAEMSPRVGYFLAQADEIRLTMQVSSFDHIRGGFENTIFFGEASTVSQKFNAQMIGTLFMNGSIFIIGLFMVLFAWYRRQEHVFFVFGMFAMLISARALFAVPFYYTMTFLNMSWVWGTRFEYILTEASSMFYVILLWQWHKKEFSKKVLYALVFIHVALIVTTLFTQPVLFQALFFKFFYLTVPTFFYLIYVIYKSIRNHNKIAKINLIGMGFVFLAFFNDFALAQNWYNGWNLMLPAVGLYVMIHVILMSKDYAERSQKTEQQNKQLLALNVSNEKLTTQLQKEVKQKDNFLANTSHELRNPLHGIINISQAILRHRSEKLDSKTEEDLELQLTIGHHMAQTLEDLLDITRLKDHQIQLQRERLDIHSVAVGVVDMLKIRLENKDIQMSLNIPNDFPEVVADKNRLIQILFNLLHNAVKFTHEGTITVTATEEGGMAHVHIADTGMGMDDTTLERIFRPYEQGDSSMTAVAGGLGLGLSICQQLVTMHGGTLEARSVLGAGSVFTFTLPIAGDTFVNQAEAQSATALVAEDLPEKDTSLATEEMIGALSKRSPAAYRPSILVIDDDPVNLRVLANILSKDQYEIDMMTSGSAALKQLDKKTWDLIISDVMMPTMSGYELTRSIREKFSITELPILLLTARGHPEDIYAGFLAGANDYVVKPVDALELNARVHTLTYLQASINERLGMEAAWLQAQIRPHFLLNTLNAIVSLSEIDTTRMSRLISKLSHYLQRSFYLKNLDKVVPLEYELDLLEAYLYIEKERFGDRLDIKWEIDAVKKVMIPPLSVQTLVENAVNHGVLKQIDGGTITIQVREKASATVISVKDDGVGMTEEQINDIFRMQIDRNKGIGLVNTEQRLRRLYGDGLHIESTPGVGTIISFEITDG